MRIDATYNVATPMFCGGADPRNSAELRLPSFKGVLRFWWRALAWQRFDGNLNEIRRQEDDVFGSSDRGQSRVLMKFAPRDRAPKILQANSVLRVSSRSNKVVGNGVRYLGYGVMEAFGSRNKGTQGGQLTRACFEAPFRFAVQCRCRGLDAEQQSSLENALIALGTFGGMGARSRKGFGSLVLHSLRVDGEEKWKPPSDMNGLKRSIRDLRGSMSDRSLPDYTAFSAQSRHLLLSSDRPESLEMLDLVGRELVRYRSWGRNGRILQSVSSERNFADDHDLMKKPFGSRRTHPRRIAFGLPHNYGRRWDQQVGPGADDLDRRASPLFVHIRECGIAPVAVLSFLPALFLPVPPKGRAGISVGGKNVDLKPVDDLYRPIHDFLDRLLDLGRRQERFTDAVEVGQ